MVTDKPKQRPLLIGRSREQLELGHALASAEPELIAIYGRRRVGKTYLVRTFFEPQMVFELVGSQNTALAQQLKNFGQALYQRMGYASPVPATWADAFQLLVQYLEPLLAQGQKKVVFLDELPWLATARSGFLEAFSYFWNSWGTRQPNLVMVICGSAAAWMIKNVLRNQGGLHNRTTLKVPVLPFDLNETEEFLNQRAPGLNRRMVLELYMALGGIPYYLNYVRAGKSAAQNIQAILFDKGGPLADEFSGLYASLFDKGDQHIAVIRALCKKKSGLSRQEISKHSKITDGGGLTKVLDELQRTGFVLQVPSFTKRKQGGNYQLVDLFTLFHLTWLEHRGKPLDGDRWLSLHSSPQWHAWSGHAFETLCLTHVAQIKKALGIAAVQSESSSWRHDSSGKTDPGAQIDLLIDRKDRVINLCEIKFTDEPFSVSAAYAAELRNKAAVFKSHTKTRKAVFITLISAEGLKENSHSLGLIDNQISAGALFG
jgi:uncharacterized protein